MYYFKRSMVFIVFVCTLCPTQTESTNESPIQQEKSVPGFPATRQKRSTNYFIDVMPVVDFKLFQKWLVRSNNNETEAESQLKDYLTQIFTTVNQRIGTIAVAGQNDVKLIVTMVSPFISKTQEASSFTESSLTTDSNGHHNANATELLQAFQTWVGEQTDLTPSDHLMLFSGYPLHASTDIGGTSNYTTGISNVATVCRGELSVSVVEDRGAYQSENVVAHELGHSLGAVHDGHSNLCESSDRYVMTDNFNYGQTLINLLNPWKFSRCSSQTVIDHLRTLEQDDSLRACLSQGAGASLSTNVKDLNYPNEVCRAFYNSESFACRGVNIPAINWICAAFFCREPGTDRCVKLFAPTGTCCGNNRACMMGQCLSVSDTTQCVMDDVCPLGDQPGEIISGKTCQQLDPHYCYRDNVRAKCCTTCENRKNTFNNTEGCIYGDKVSGCSRNSCGVNTPQGLEYQFLCCHTCESATCVDNTLINNMKCEEYINDTGISSCYRDQVNSGCCATCEKLRKKSKPECPFGDNTVKINCTLLKGFTRDCTSEEDEICCETCPKAKPTEAPSSSTTSSGTRAVPSSTQSDRSQGSGREITKPMVTVLALSLVVGAILAKSF